jgi:hypothetical protein
MVREFFADVEVERWDAPLLDLPDRRALLSWLRGYGVSDEDARRVAGQVATPLTLTKRGALIWAYKRS